LLRNNFLGMRKIFPIMVAALAIAGIWIISNDNMYQSETITETVSDISPISTNIEPTITTLDQKEWVVSPETIIVEPFSTVANSESVTSNFILPLLQPSFAIPSVQSIVTSDEWTIPTSSPVPRGIAVDPTTGNVFFSEAGPDKIGRLDPSTNVITEWKIPEPANIHGGITVDTAGNVYFPMGAGGADTIARLVPSTNVLTFWGITPALDDDWEEIILDTAGNVYFTMRSNDNAIARLVPSTNTFTEWLLPEPGGDGDLGLVGITIDSSNNVFVSFDEEASGLGRLVPSTNVYTQWTFTGSEHPLGMDVDSADNVYFTSPFNPNFGESSIGRLVPSTNVITKWAIPISPSIPIGIVVDSNDNVYFTRPANPVAGDNTIGRLVPSTNVLTEWDIPTASSFPERITVDSNDNVYFTESAKIGRLS